VQSAAAEQHLLDVRGVNKTTDFFSTVSTASCSSRRNMPRITGASFFLVIPAAGCG